MGGATTEAPIVDNDAIWLGSSRGGSPSNSFRGWLDKVAIHRTILSDATVAARFHRVGGPRIVGPLPEAMPDLPDVPEGRTLLTISEGMPSHDRWLNQGESWPPEFTRWLGEEFLLPRIPLRFDTWGIRESWKAPLLVRMVADVPLPPGQHRFLLRARGLSRLWVNGQVVARTKAVTASPPDGEERITPVAEPPLPGQRPRGYHQQESFANVSVGRTADESTSRVRVVLELVVGGKNQRTETGEVCVAVLTADGDSYVVLQPRDDRELPLTDAAIEPALSRIESLLARHDDLVRRTAAASQDVFWNRRHLAARAWANEHPAPTTPRYSDHPIDGFVTAKIKRALRASEFSNVEEAAHFHGQILPILRKHCFRCHGEKDAGGLKLNTREFALKGGDSEMPAIVPGDPAASELIVRIREEDEDLRMPPTESGLDPDEIAALEKWVATEAPWPAPPITAAEVALAARGDG